MFYFCPFLALFELFYPAQSAPIVQSRPDGFRCSQCCQPIGNGSPQGRRKRNKEKSRSRLHIRSKERNERKAATSPQAHKERGTPPHRQGAGSRSPHHKFAPKNQQKVALGSFEKIFGKIFRGNVSGERKTPRVISTEGGCLINENREISNLAMQVTKNAQKHYLITKGKGRQKESHLQGLLRICHKVAVVFVGFHSCDILFDLSCVGISAFWVMELDSLVGIV